MANDASIRQIDDLVKFSFKLKKLGDAMYSNMQQAQKEMNLVSYGWNDKQNEKFKMQFDQSVNDIKKMSERFSEYANYIKKIKEKIDEYKAIR